jgi:hypothetical protein
MRSWLPVFAVILFMPVFAETVKDCADLGAECAEQCEQICGQERYDYCREFEYSGCALDVFCWCNVCGIYDAKWCPMTGFLGCASGAKGAYTSCVDGCNSKLRAGQDVSTCWADCNTEFDTAVQACKDALCPEFCQGEGFTTGSWARYTEDYGWDSCYCEGEVEEDFENVAFPTEDDSDADGIPDRQDWCPYDEGESTANGCPDGDLDGVPDEGDKCPNEYGTWEYAGCKKTGMDIFAETPYAFKDWVVWLFTKQGSAGNKNRGFIKALKNKEGVRIFRPSIKKWIRVGAGTQIFEEDRILTRSDSRVKVIIFDDFDNTQNVVDILPNTLFEAPSSYDRYKGERPIVHVIKGVIKTIKRRVSGDKPGFYVKTPTVCVGVRGTEFIVAHDPDTEKDTVMVIEGKVQVNGTTTMNLEPGQQVEAAGGVLSQAQLLDEARRDELTGELEDWDETAEEPEVIFPFDILAVVLLVAAALFFFLKIRG